VSAISSDISDAIADSLMNVYWKLHVRTQCLGWTILFDPTKTWLDGELKGLDFLRPDDAARQNWKQFWPQQGNPPNWDAVARISRNGIIEWLLVEAKANVQELRSSCNAKAEGGRPMIARTLAAVKSVVGVSEDRDWLNGYYQYCNRIAVLEFLNRQGAPAQLMFIYFVGDKGDAKRTCPADFWGWQTALKEQKAHVGLGKHHLLSDRIYELFLDVCPRKEDAVRTPPGITPM
jgi:hypothetical protein